MIDVREGVWTEPVYWEGEEQGVLYNQESLYPIP